ncbi:MAG: helix-turn-helix domain-containing protein [Dolichospermum sp.]
MIKKKRITIAAVPELIKQAETALIKLGFESKSNFAESQLISRNTVTNFFQGKSIQIDSLKRICEALKLNWQDFVTTEQPVEIPSIDSETKIIIIKVVITLDGDINSVDKIEFLQDMQAILRQYSGTITDVKSGSIKLFIEGNQAGIEKLVDLIQGKILTELNGFPIQSIEMLHTDENRDDQQNNIVSLSGKFDKRNFPVGWDVPRNFLNQKSLQREQNLAFKRRGKNNEENEIAKIINSSQINIPLLLKIKKEETEATKDNGLYSLTLQVCTTNADDKLPANLKILVFYEASREMIDEKIVGRKTLRSSFMIESQVPFYIEIKLGAETIEKGLYVL